MLALEGITHSYDAHEVLSDVTLRVDDGEFVVLVGANGAGKTTLLDVISGLLEPTRGSISVNGADPRENPLAVRTAVGRVFEEPRDQLLASPVEADVAFGPENLGLDHDAIEARVASTLEAVGMGDQRDTPIESLSGGERARVAIAGALAIDPELLVLDEPTAGLDHRGRMAVLRHLGDVNDRGVSVVLATHDLRDLYDDIDRVIGLDSGRVVLDGRPAAVGDRLPSLGVRVPDSWPMS